MKKTVVFLSLLLALLIALCATSCSFGGTSPEPDTNTDAREGTEGVNTSADVTTDGAATDEITTAEQTEPAPPEPVDYTYAGITLSVPSDFKEIDQGGTKQLVPADYPEHADNISLTLGSGSASLYTEELLRTTVTQLLDDVQDFTYTRDTVSGLDRVIISYRANVSGVLINQENVSIFTPDGKVYSITYTSVSDVYKAFFATSRDSIKINDAQSGTEAAPAEPVEYTYSGITLTVPGDFREMDQSGIRVLVPADYPARADNISFTVAAGSVTGYTEEIVVASLKQFLGDIQDFAYAKDTKDGLDRIIFTYTVVASGVSMRQESVNLFSSGKVYNVTFTSVSNDFTDAFETAKNSIKITG